MAVEPAKKARAPLTRERVLRAAVELADERGIEALTMRALGQALGVEAMSLYNHVENKADILHGIVDVVCEEIVAAVGDIPAPDDPAEWKAVLRSRILAARKVLLSHPWAPSLLESLTDIPPSLIGYYDAQIGLMRDGGFSLDLAHHALHALGSRGLGFTQELFVQADSAVDPRSTIGGCDDQFEFEFGLDVILDGLDRLREADWHLPAHS